MPQIKLSRRTITAIESVQRSTIFYDTELTGFGLKIQPSGVASWIIEYRPGAGGRSVPPRRLVLGRSNALTPDQARKLASELLAKVRLGADPAEERSQARTAETLGDLLDLFMDNHIRPKRKERTVILFGGYIRNHIRPVLGRRKAPTLAKAEVEKLHRSIGKSNPVTANRVIALVAAAYSFGRRTGILPRETANPAAGIEKFRENARERFLTEAELARLGEAIREAETIGIPWPEPDRINPKSKHVPRRPENRLTIISPYTAAALRLLIFTGARLREILDLQWDHVDLERGLLFLPDSKTGKKTIVLGGAACSVLTTLPRSGKYVIAGNDPEKPRADLQRPWGLVCRRAGLEGVRLHDLRHSFASVGAGAGLGLPIIGKLLGHLNSKTTERYAHLAAGPVRHAADSVSAAIAKAMGELIDEAAA
jgi:integrase